MERVQEDPVWHNLFEETLRSLGNDEASVVAAGKLTVRRYIMYYLSQESLLTNNPGGNGPASLRGVNVLIPAFVEVKESPTDGCTASCS